MDYCIVGAGMFGSVLARLMAEKLSATVLVIDKRAHIGGNCYSRFDAETGIECHTYGSHIFHTSNADVWNFLNRFTSFTNYQHKVYTRHKGTVYAMPINLGTVNQFYGRDMTPTQAADFLEAEKARDAISAPKNLEEKAITLIGRPLYEAFIKGYTTKQWGKAPTELAADIITRLPVRLNYNANYFNDPWQGVPTNGYTALFAAMLDHPLITVQTDTEFAAARASLGADCRIVYTGMLDALCDYCYGDLEWRSLHFVWENVAVQDYQGCSVMNYADVDVPYTRIHEFKHYNPERTEPFNYKGTVICREFSQDYTRGKDAFYPVNNARNDALHARYVAKVTQEMGILVGGRLGAYRYWDMDKAAAAAMQFFAENLAPQQV